MTHLWQLGIEVNSKISCIKSISIIINTLISINKQKTINMNKTFLTKQQIIAKKELAAQALKQAEWEANIVKALPKKNQRGPINYLSPNIREKKGYCIAVS